MKATILKLSGKYYGTEINVELDSGDTTLLKVWVNCGIPSVRQIEEWGYTREEWDSNAVVDDGWGGKERIRWLDLLCDSHYECEESLLIAEKIVKALSDTH